MPEQENVTVDLPSEGAPVAVEVEPNIESQASSEHEEYSGKVQKRIDKLTRKVREAERQQQAALEFAKGVQTENQQLKHRVTSLDAGYVNEYGDRIATEQASVTKDMQEAVATGDSAKQVELNKKMAQLAIEEERVRAAKTEQERQAKMAQSAAQQPRQPSAAPQAPPVRTDPKATDWASKNEWFGEDDAMTFAAFGIHKRLVEEEGFDTSSPEYYDEIDKRIREAFPHKFNGEVSVSDSRRPQQTVASAVRTSGTGRATVRLSPSEVAIAKKLGVSLEEYAKHKHTMT
jgi:hypothetical protein